MKKRCEIEKVAVTDESIMLRFEATCTDARYEYEQLFLKNVTGYGIRNDRYDTYIEKSPGEWLEVDSATLVIYFEDKEHDEDDRE